MDQGQPEVQLTVVVDPDRFDAVVQALEDNGIRVEAEWREVGTILCRVTPERIAEVSAVDGVLLVEQGRTIQLPPPDEDIQ